MNYLLLFASVFMDTIKNMCYNQFARRSLKNNKDALAFNVIGGICAVVFFALIGAPIKVSAFSFWLALFFAGVTFGAQYLSLMAISLGSMSFSVLITYLSMLVTIMFGVICYGHPMGFLQIMGIVLMMVTFYLSLDRRGHGSVNIKWLFAAMGSLVFWGLVGICQMVHQNSVYAAELDGFLLWTFIFLTAMFSLMWLITPVSSDKPSGYKFGSKITLFVILAGLFVGATNKVNLYLSGVMSSVILFPVLNGGVIILSALASIFVFHEKLTVRQKLGLIIGVIAVLCLGM